MKSTKKKTPIIDIYKWLFIVAVYMITVFVTSSVAYATEEGQETIVGDVNNDNEDSAPGNEEAGNYAEPFTGVVYENDSYYYYVNGEMQTIEGLVEWNGNSYYVTQTGALAADQIVFVDGGYFYADENAIIRKTGGWITVKGDQYLLKSDGRATVESWIKDSKGWQWFDQTGKLVKNQRISYKGNWYYLKSDTYMADNGWAREGSRWIYAQSGGSLAKNKWIWSGSQWYYLKNDGYMAAHEWVKYGSYWYWMEESGIIARSKWVYTGGKWYYLKANGYMAASEWFWYGSNWYYLNGSGAMASNQWVKSSGYWYYLKANGCMAKSEWIKAGGKWYYLKSNGKMAANEWVSSYWVNGSGVYIIPPVAPSRVQSYYSQTMYLITVDRSTHYVTVYYGSKGHRVQLMGFSCGDGKASTPTITGEYSIPNKYPRSRPYFDSEGARCWYPTRINGPYLFHSVLYYPSGSPTNIADGRLGAAVSHGCVRLAVDHAKWIYDNIPIGSKVVIY